MRLNASSPGPVRVDASYGFQGEAGGGTVAVEMAGTVVGHAVSPTGQTVGEPNRSWHIDNFVSHLVGEVEIPEPGVYEDAPVVVPSPEWEPAQRVPGDDRRPDHPRHHISWPDRPKSWYE